MPELPEVETTRRGLLNKLVKQTIDRVDITNRRLRKPIDRHFERRCQNQTIINIEREAKYLKLLLDKGYILIHLGMSGHLRVIPKETERRSHDHVEIHLKNGLCLRYHDPRRFGVIEWSDLPSTKHPLLKHLGLEPLSDIFSADYLYNKAKKSTRAIKNVIMDAKIVVGVGNIYAQEALFLAAIHPKRKANQISIKRYQDLVNAIKTVLQQAIKQGGTSLKDFYQTDGKPGYFTQALNVYGRTGEPCKKCQKPLINQPIANRQTVYCQHCQR